MLVLKYYRGDNMRIAIITAMEEEMLPILKKLGNVVDESNISGVHIKKIELGANTVYLAQSGVGEIKAALAVQVLVDLFDVEAVLNFGFVGALNNNLSIGELVICSKVCHYQFDVTLVDTDRQVGQYSGMKDNFFYLDKSLINDFLHIVGKNIKTVSVASGDKFVAGKENKTQLSSLGCDICEMELAGLAIACERNSIPLFSIKVVSDKADESASESFVSVVEKGMSKYEKLLPDVLEAVCGEKKSLPPVVNKRR